MLTKTGGNRIQRERELGGVTLVRERDRHHQPESSDLQMMSLKSNDVFNNRAISKYQLILKIDVCFHVFFFLFLIKVFVDM